MEMVVVMMKIPGLHLDFKQNTINTGELISLIKPGRNILLNVLCKSMKYKHCSEFSVLIEFRVSVVPHKNILQISCRGCCT